MKTIVVIDLANVAISSYYSKPLINYYGMNVNMIKGFFFRINSALNMFNPDYLVFAEDIPRSDTFRRKMFPPYKAKRKPSNKEITDQIIQIKNLIILLGFPMLKYEPYEADDVAGMIAKYGDDHNFETIIISSDKDLYQLVSDRTSIYSMRNGGEFIDREYMLEHYSLLPSQWTDLKILQGDNSDNIPGIRGIGPSTALSLLQKYESIENIYQHLKELPKQIQFRLAQGRKDIPLLRDLVTIVTDYDKVKITEDSFKRGDVFAADVMQTINDLDIRSLQKVMWFKLIPYMKKEET